MLNIIKGFLPLFFFVLICYSCSNKINQTSWTGILEPAGITSYQYGTHRLVSDDTLFALRSIQIDLVNYEYKKVKISGNSINGYPLEGGPVFIEVSEIEMVEN